MIERELILEYIESLGIDLSFQDIERELATLDTFYEVMLVGENNAGIVALRRIDGTTCEMKRLYVRPQYRGRGIGRELAARAIEEARRRGYKRVRLDTLPSMKDAMKLYEELGFVDIAPYRANPIAGSRFMELTIGR